MSTVSDSARSVISGPTPALVSDWLLAAAVRQKSHVSAIECIGDGSAVVTLQGGATERRTFDLDVDLAAACVVRLASLADLDPLVDATSPRAASNVARLGIRVGSERAELLVSAWATELGMNVELRLLTIDGRPPDRRYSLLKRCATCARYCPGRMGSCPDDGGVLVALRDAAERGGTVGMYRLDRALGEGGMGRVFAGRHALLDREVAIKVLARGVASQPAAARSFLAEARAASYVRHPNVVDVLDYGLMTNGQPFMVMERLSGQSLLERIDDAGALELEESLGVAEAAGAALGAIHAAGILHNDLKPSNVVLLGGPNAGDRADRAGVRLKLIDFGAASALAASEASLMGTPQFMSPERARGDPPDVRSDLYSLGIMLYEMICGAAPFTGTIEEILIAHVRTEPPPLASPHGPVPRGIGRIVSRLLSKRPDERHQSAAELVHDLKRARGAVDRRGWRQWLP